MIQSFFCLVASNFSISQALTFFKDLAEARAGAKKVFQILDTKSAIDPFESNGKKLENLRGRIEFENLCFSYPQRPEAQILKDVNLKIEAGKTIALVGFRLAF